MKTAAVSLVERADGRILCVWNLRYGGWSLPGGLVEEGETIVAALERELREETGCYLREATLIFVGPHGVDIGDTSRAKYVNLFRVRADGEASQIEEGCPVTWFTREQFLKWSPFRDLYRMIFAAMASGLPLPLTAGDL